MKRKFAARSLFISATMLAIALLAFGQSSTVVKTKGYVSVDSVRPGDKFKIAVAIEIAPGYHIQAHVPSEAGLVATVVTLTPPAGIRVNESTYPAPKYQKFDFSEDQAYAVHDGTIYITADAEADGSLKPGAASIHARVTVQSCDDKTCLQPSDLELDIPLNFIAAGKPIKEANADVFAKAAAAPTFEGGDKNTTAGPLVEYKGNSGSNNWMTDLLEKGSIPAILAGVFIAGLALNLTPCVYPIIPITIGFFVNQSATGGTPRLRRTFTMAAMYVLGMAITYSILGVVAAKSGGLFGAALQNPIVLIAFAALMIALSLSMFGVYEFKMPDSLNRFADSTTQATSGTLGALVMGLTMGIVAAPCIGPFVLVLLLHVSAKGSAAYGFMLFFVLALGLGFPYLILGTFSGAIKSLPRSGVWMVTVRKVFGLIMVGMAIYFLLPLLGKASDIVIIAFFAVSALYLLFYESGKARPKQFAWVLRAIGAAAAVAAIMFALPKKIEAEIAWQPYSEQLLAVAQREGRGVIIDTYADWCIPCKELDRYTFTDASVAREADRFVALKLNITSNEANSEAGRAQSKFGIRGVPTIVFLDPSGHERADLRLEGFEKPALFLARLKQIEFTPKVGGLKIVKDTGTETGKGLDARPGTATEPLPAVSLNLIKGGQLATDSLRGKVALINFWATWCVPCKAEIPTFNQFDKDYKARGLEIVGIALDEEGAAKVKPFLKENPMNYAVAVGDKSTATAFSVDDTKLPITLIVDKQGRVRFRHVGIEKKEVFEAEIGQLLNE
jgi:thiol:disulfide interchange protein DsbD